MLERILTYLQSLETEPYVPLQETTVSQGIKEAIGETKEKATGPALYEIIAFDLYPRHEGRTSEWGTYFGSMMSGHTEDPNEPWEYPSRKSIDAETIKYWSKRAREANHPVLVERYADAAFDLAHLVEEKPDHTLAQLAIDSIIEVCKEGLVEGIYQRQDIHRALSLARKIADKDRLKLVVSEIIRIEREIAEDDKPGLWGFAFNWLVLQEKNPSNLEESQIQDLVKELEDRLTRLLGADDPDPWGVECVVNLLAPYYAKKEEAENMLRVLLALEDAYRRNGRSNSDALLKLNYIEKLDALYRQNGKLPGMRAHIERIAKELPEASKKAVDSMQTISTPFEIKAEDIERMKESIFGKGGVDPGPMKEIITRLIASFLVKREGVERQVDKYAKEFVFQFIVQQRRMSSDGRTEVIIPPLGEDYEAHVFNQAFQNMQFDAPFLQIAMDTFKERFTLAQIEEYLSQSILFQNEDQDYLHEGLKAYWEGTYLTASQNFLPYIEAGFRRLIERGGGVVLRPGVKYGGYEYRSLDSLLEEEIINRVFGFDISFHFKMLLTHPLGWNLRNNLAHGIGLSTFFRADVADRLFHLLLILSLVKKGESPKDETPN